MGGITYKEKKKKTKIRNNSYQESRSTYMQQSLLPAHNNIPTMAAVAAYNAQQLLSLIGRDQTYFRYFASCIPSPRLNILVNPPTTKVRSWSSLVMTWASQAYNPGSNPGDRIFYTSSNTLPYKYQSQKICLLSRHQLRG